VFVLAGTTDESLLGQADLLVRLALVRKLATNQFAHKAPLSRAEAEALEPLADFARVYAALKDEQVIEPGAAWKDIGFAHAVPSTEHPTGYEGYIGLQEVLARGFETLTIVEDGLFKAAQGQTGVGELVRIAQG
jgi:hypothetical protein